MYWTYQILVTLAFAGSVRIVRLGGDATVLDDVIIGLGHPAPPATEVSG